jgi:hypothetical protein
MNVSCINEEIRTDSLKQQLLLRTLETKATKSICGSGSLRLFPGTNQLLDFEMDQEETSLTEERELLQSSFCSRRFDCQIKQAKILISGGNNKGTEVIVT